MRIWLELTVAWLLHKNDKKGLVFPRVTARFNIERQGTAITNGKYTVVTGRAVPKRHTHIAVRISEARILEP
jgi:hypothetical protein